MPAPLNNAFNIPTKVNKDTMNETTKKLVAGKNLFSSSQLWGRTLKDESLIAQSVQNIHGAMTEDEPLDKEFNANDSLKEELFSSHSDLIHPDFKDEIFNSRNQLHFEDQIEHYKQETAKEKEIEAMGISGSLMRMGSAMADLPLYIAGVATAELTVPALAVGAGRTMFSRALVGGTTETAIVAGQDYLGEMDKKELDYQLAFAFGAGVNSLFRYNPLLGDTAKRAMNSTLKADVLAKKLDGVTDEVKKEAITKNHYAGLKLNSNQFKTIQESVNHMKDAVKNGALDKNVYDRMRVDLAYMTKASDSETMRGISDSAFIDGTLQANKTNFRSGAEAGQEVEDIMIDSYLSTFDKLKKDFDSEFLQHNWIRARFGDSMERISRIAGAVQMRRNLHDTTDAEAWGHATELFMKEGMDEDMAMRYGKQMVANLDKDALDSHRILSEYKKKGFESGEIKPNNKYMPIQYDKNMAQKLGDKGITYKDFERFINDSIVSKATKSGTTLTQPELDEIAFMAKGLSSGVWKNSESLQGTQSLDSALKKLLDEDEQFSGLKDKYLSATKTEKDGVVFVERRSPFDYSFVKEVNTEKGTQTIGFEDLVNSNYFGVKNMYARKMGGGVTRENIKVKRTTTEFDYDKVKTAKDVIKNNIKIARKALKDIGRLEGDLNLDTILSVSKQFFKDVPSAQDIIKMTNKQERADLLNKFVDDSLVELKKVLDKTENDIEDIVPEEFRKDIPAIRENMDKLIDKLTRIASDVHKGLDPDAKNYDDLFKKEMDKATGFFRDELKILNDKVDDFFKKEITDELDLGTEEGIKHARKQMEQELIEAGVSDKKKKAELTRFDEMMNEWKGNPTSTDPFGTLTQGQRIAKNMNIARLLGQTGFTMSAEFGNAIFHTGVKNFMEFSSMKSLVKQMKSGEMDDKFAQELQTHMGIGSGLLRAIQGNVYEHEFNMSNRGMVDSMLDRLEGVSEKFAEATLLVGGVKPLTAYMETTIAKDAINNLTMMFGKGGAKMSARDIKDLAELGVDDAMVKRIQAQFDKHGKFVEKKWSKGHKVDELNFDAWEDQEAKDMLVTATRRITNTIIQRSYMGDKVGATYNGKLFRNTLFGKMALELKDYMVTAYVKQLGRALGRKDAYIAGMMMTQIGALSTATALQNYMNFAGNEEKLEKSFDPVNFARNIIGKTTVSSYVPLVTDSILNSMTGERAFSSSRYHTGIQGAMMGMPTLDLLMKVQGILSAPVRTAVEGEVANRDVTSLFGLAPLGNTMFARPIKEAIVAD